MKIEPVSTRSLLLSHEGINLLIEEQGSSLTIKPINPENPIDDQIIDTIFTNWEKTQKTSFCKIKFIRNTQRNYNF